MKFSKVFFLVYLFTATSAAPTERRAASSSFLMQNGLDAQKLNAQFASLAASDACTAGTEGCVQGSFAQCVGVTWALNQCAAGTSCFALPLVNKQGTSITCDTHADASARIAATGAQGGIFGNGFNSTQLSSVPSSMPLAVTSSLASGGSLVPSVSSASNDCVGAESVQPLPSNSVANCSSGSSAGFINLDRRAIIFAPPSTTVGSSSSVSSFDPASVSPPGSSLFGSSSSVLSLFSSSSLNSALSTSLPAAGGSPLSVPAGSSSTSAPSVPISFISSSSSALPLFSSSSLNPVLSTSLPAAGGSSLSVPAGSSSTSVPLPFISNSNLSQGAASSSSASLPVPSVPGGGSPSCGTITVTSTVFFTVTQFGNTPSSSTPGFPQSSISLPSFSSSGSLSIPSAMGSSSNALLPGSSVIPIPGSSTSVPAGFGSSSTPAGLFPSATVLGSSGSVFSSSVVSTPSGGIALSSAAF